MTKELDFPAKYSHQEAEARASALWEEHKIYRAEVDETKEPFCVVIPPPNVTGILHMGHVLDNTPQDIMTRWHRMRGFSAVWIPGTDHAGIATQSVVKKKLEKEGIDIRDLGREEFVKRVWAFKEEHGSLIINQLKRLGCSCDWERERFTMDEGLSKAVLTAFLHYFKKGLIYKGKRMINWCTACSTALSNEEVEHANVGGHLWHLRYPMLGSDGSPTGKFAIVATTRPETMLGDTAVAVNPEDERYQDIVGHKILLPLVNREIPIVADSFVDPSFGTGMVKVTPAHDPNDYQMGLNHSLEMIEVIGLDGNMTEAAGEAYAGLDRAAARKKVVADMEAQGLLEDTEKYSHAVGECYRCHSVIEPMISDQWFVKMKPLAEKAREAVVSGKIKVIPDSEKHDFFHWIDSIQDWCISRQLWWGHRIPVYYCDDCEHVMASMETPEKCDKCSSLKLTQDEDVLDTWFSSALWPFSTLGWPEKTKELEYWYPNNWLMSGRDIIFFWDARMIMAGLELMGEVPFRTLALHGLVRDDQGRKLSKSLNNSPDPLQLFDEYGTDAVRAAITYHYPMGRQDTKLSSDVYKKGQALLIKLWNASKLLLTSAGAANFEFDSRKLKIVELEDRWIISRLGKAIEAHDKYLNQTDLVHALESISNFFWNEFCDWYLEIIKPRLQQGGEGAHSALETALHCKRTLLKLFHPYIPFVTEELWRIWGENSIRDVALENHEKITLATCNWPEKETFTSQPDDEKVMSQMMSMVRSIRDVRAHLVIPPKVELQVALSFISKTDGSNFESYRPLIENLANIGTIEVQEGTETPDGFVPSKFDGGVVFVSIPESVDPAAIKKQLDNKILKLEKALNGINARLSNESFIESAPAELVEETKAKEAEMKAGLEKFKEFHSSLK